MRADDRADLQVETPGVASTSRETAVRLVRRERARWRRQTEESPVASSRDREQAGDFAWRINLLLMVGIIVAAVSVPALLTSGDQLYLAKLATIVMLSFVPGWLYLQFAITKGKTLWDEYVLSLHRLGAASEPYLPPAPAGSRYRKQGDDPSPMCDPRNLFAQKFISAYGEIALDSKGMVRARFRGDAFRPVLLATLLLVAGWTLVLQPEPYQNITIFDGLLPSGRPELPADALRYGFIGAYLFIAQAFMRRYFQNDLKANAYISAIVRIISVALIVVVLHSVWPEPVATYEPAFAFFVGIFPQLGLQAARAFVGRGLNRLLPNLDTKYPLGDLDGMDLWYEARLLEEGIEDLQNLATANIVDLMLYTRVPLERLIDWIDQAHLYLRVSNERPKDRDGHDSGLSDREILRQLGIRSATDLQDAFELIVPQDIPEKELERRLDAHRRRVKRLAVVLNTGGREDWPPILGTVLTSLQGEPNLCQVRRWKGLRTSPSY